MAQKKLPDALTRRHLVERELSAAQALRYAETYLEEGRVLEAIDFLSKAEADDRLAELRSAVIEQGDLFALRAVAAATGVAVERGEWIALAEAAEAAGKETYAADARQQASRGED